MTTEVLELKRALRAKDLAYLAGKKRQSPRTGFIHLFYGGNSLHGQEQADTIPIYENICFVLALLFQKKGEAILEAKQLLLRLLDFQVDNFPIYLHDFPRCYDFYLGLKIAPLLLRIQAFRAVLGETVGEKIDATLHKIFSFYEGKECTPLWAFRLDVSRAVFFGRPFPLHQIDTSQFLAADWWEYWISLQFIERPVCHFYHSGLQMAIGLDRQQDFFEPSPQMIDWICTEDYLPHLLKDRPAHLHLVALDPVEVHSVEDSLLLQGGDVYWKGISSIHSLYSENIVNGVAVLPISFEMGRDDLFEVAYYCDASPDTELWVDGKKGNVFSLGQTVEIKSSTRRFTLTFELLRGEGEFCGHIFRSNRPNQIGVKTRDQYEAFDWKIGLRTLRRSSDCAIRIILTSA